jgi:hypothetical protein
MGAMKAVQGLCSVCDEKSLKRRNALQLVRGDKAMARIGMRPGRDYQQIGQVVLAAWFKALDAATLGAANQVSLPDLEPEIEAVLRETLEDTVLIGGVATPIKINVLIDDTLVVNIVIPKWPASVTNTTQLVAYLQNYHDRTGGRHYDEELGQAVVFGCGR